MTDLFDFEALQRRYLALLLQGRRGDAVKMVMAELDMGLSIEDLYLKVFQPALAEVGRLWENDQIKIAQEHYVTAATQSLMAQFYPLVFSSERIGKTFVAAIIGDQLHELGLRMVADFLEMRGWDTVFLGNNLPKLEIVDAISIYKASAIGLSVTFPHHIGDLTDIVSIIKNEPSTKDVHILVGGQAFNSGDFDWRKTGADSYACDAAQAASYLTNWALSG